MKVKVTKTTEYDIPEGDYCQKEDGSIDCKYFNYDINPFLGTIFECSMLKKRIDVPFDNKRIRDKRNIKKLNECLALTKIDKITVIKEETDGL